MKGYEEKAFVAARGETIGFFLREKEVLRTATGGEEGGATTTKREVSSGEGGGGGDENGGIVERGEKIVGADVAPLLVEETTVIETLIVEEMENEENTEEKQKDVEAEEEETREPAMVLKTDSGTEVDLAKLKSAADVAPEMGGYLKKLQHQLSILLGGGSRSSD
jgi:hypothetical protein